MRRRSLAGGLMLPFVVTKRARAAGWPDRPVRFLMPGGPGSNPDILSRILAQRLTEVLGVSVVVENRPGASGIIGTETVFNAQPDGYTMLFGYNQLVTLNRLLFKRLPYDPARFSRVSLVSDTPFVMLVPRDLPARDVPEFVALAKSRPGGIAWGTTGPGTFAHLCGELLMRDAGVEMLHVPFRVTPRNELISGQIQLAFEPTALAVTLTRGPDARVRALAVLGNNPEPELPGVPLMKSYFPGFVAYAFHGIWGPPNMAPEAVASMAKAMTDLAGDPWVTSRFQPLATRFIAQGPAALDLAMRDDLVLWEKVVRERNIQLD